ncbi:hypothetical protein [Sphingopyxis sp. C-1]|uniref:hypothetical protein n=1 Tax=Sphingopyxis sp. C-1 TaxID=262667 RepID=UPI00187C2300|nr:hypothetical protein [Sphingopyxis sp. C-1]
MTLESTVAGKGELTSPSADAGAIDSDMGGANDCTSFQALPFHASIRVTRFGEVDG